MESDMVYPEMIAEQLLSNFPIRILVAEESVLPDDVFVAMHTHPYHQLHCLVKGSLWIDIGPERYLLKPGVGVLIPPFIKHAFQSTYKGMPRQCYAKFEMDPVWERMITIAPFFIFRLGKRFRALVADWESAQEIERIGAQIELSRLLIELLDDKRNSPVASDVEHPTRRDWLTRTLTYIEENAEKPLTVSDLASHAAMSVNHFSRRFKSLMKQTPSRFVQQVKCEKAKRRLLKGDSCKEIADRFGFYGTAHFNHVFKRLYDIAPTKWRDDVLEK